MNKVSALDVKTPSKFKAPKPVAPRLWSKVEKTASGCWLWCGAAASTGYGEIYVNGVRAATHRVAYELSKGPIPDGHVVRHTCDVRRCINPEHLLIGLPADNTADMIRRNRGRNWGRGLAAPAGKNHPSAKLTWAAVREIRRQRALGVSGIELARRFAISPQAVCDIVKGKSWKEPT